MAQLTEAQKRDFSRQVTEILKPLTVTLTAKGFDPKSRITQLESGADSIDQADAAALAATELKNNLLANHYTLASATVDLVESLLGKDDPNVRGLRQIRSSMSASPGAPSPAPAPVKPGA